MDVFPLIEEPCILLAVRNAWKAVGPAPPGWYPQVKPERSVGELSLCFDCNVIAARAVFWSIAAIETTSTPFDMATNAVGRSASPKSKVPAATARIATPEPVPSEIATFKP